MKAQAVILNLRWTTTLMLLAIASGQAFGEGDVVQAGDESCMQVADGICGDAKCSSWSLGSLIKPSDHCFDDFISPMSNFVFFEDPRTLTEARAIFFHHELPDSIGTLGLPGGDVQLYALQLRFALTERLSVIAVKDGYIVADIDGAPLDDLLSDGWADVTAGLKYNLLRDSCEGRLLSAGFTYEIPIGSRRALQDIADGEFHVFATGGTRLFDGLAHYLGAVGYRFPVNDDLQSTALHWSNHFDVKVSERLYAFTEFVWWHWTDSANTGLNAGVSGQDVFNIYATDVTGNDLVTQSVGMKYKPSGHSELGIAYEFPLTDFQDIIANRLQLELILRY
jgi:hypothetical protein